MTDDELELPRRLRVGVSRTGSVFHLVKDGQAVCYEAPEVAEEMTVSQASEDGYRPCWACFRLPQEREIPSQVVVALGAAGTTVAYHAERKESEDLVPRCDFGPVTHDEQTYIKVPRKTAESAGLDPCTGCFGAAAKGLAQLCPLCAEQLDGRMLARHLGGCSAAEEVA